jgi:hypothetical protein
MTARGTDEAERHDRRVRRERALAQAEWTPERWERHRWREGHAIYVPEVDPC